MSHRSNVLDTHLNNLVSNASYIQASSSSHIHVESKPELEKLITSFHYPQSVYAQNRIDRNDASGSQNVNMLIVSGILINNHDA